MSKALVLSKETAPAVPSPSLTEAQKGFARHLIKWQRLHGRHDLPWQKNLQPYPVWLSEVMLQQTQVSTVKAYFEKFMTRFPRIEDLAQAQEEEVMSLWSGLGYYSRGRNLHACAQRVVADFKGEFPSSMEDLVKLPGIGPSTAAAIASICFSQKAAIMDGNVARVLTRYLGFSEDLSQSANQRGLKQLAQLLLPSKAKDMPTYTQGIMDLGATVCMPKRVLCERCPVQSTCYAHAHDLISALPLKSKKIKRKHKSIYWLIAINDRFEVLGGKRALGGIWAGMHAFPEFESEAALRASLPAVTEVQALTVVQHELTHLSLSIHGFLWQEHSTGSSRPSSKRRIHKPHVTAVGFNPPGYAWMGLEEWAQVGRPKPVSDFLEQVKALE